MSKNKLIGKCCICGKEKVLTFEHIPPNKALNDKEARFITGENVIQLVTSKDRMPWETDGLRYEQEQRGYGKYSLCADCNNYTGANYGNEYCKIAKEFAAYMYFHNDEIIEGSAINLKIKDFYPLLFIKQVLSMFCSTTEGLSDTNSSIREVLLKKEAYIDNPDFKISMFLVKNNVTSWTGHNVMLIGLDKIRSLSEIIAYPFGFILDFDKNYEDKTLLDITSFLKYKYDEKAKFEITIPLYEKNMPFPTDFRTKEQVNEAVKKAKTVKMDHS